MNPTYITDDKKARALGKRIASESDLKIKIDKDQHGRHHFHITDPKKRMRAQTIHDQADWDELRGTYCRDREEETVLREQARQKKAGKKR